MSIERGLLVVMIVCLLALALMGGQMLRTNALEVVLGVVVGLAAAVPVALLLVALKGQREQVEVRGPSAALCSAQDAKAPAKGVVVRLGTDLGGIPMDLLVGGNGAKQVLVVRAPAVRTKLVELLAVGGWFVQWAESGKELVDQVQFLREKADYPPTVTVIDEMADLFKPEWADSQAVEDSLQWLATHGAQRGHCLLMATGQPERLNDVPVDAQVRIAGAGLWLADLATALGITQDEAADLTDAGVCWLSAQGKVTGFRPEVG